MWTKKWKFVLLTLDGDIGKAVFNKFIKGWWNYIGKCKLNNQKKIIFKLCIIRWRHFPKICFICWYESPKALQNIREYCDVEVTVKTSNIAPKIDRSHLAFNMSRTKSTNSQTRRSQGIIRVSVRKEAPIYKDFNVNKTKLFIWLQVFNIIEFLKSDNYWI